MTGCDLHALGLLDPHARGERRVHWVLLLTLATMVAEILAGYLFRSMALTADGWHMGTHAAAFGIAIFAYRYARRHAGDPRFSFGTGKVGVLGGFASAVGLAVVALLMAAESIHRLVAPQAIRFDEAIAVAFVGLAVNIASAFLLREEHPHEHGHGHHEHDHNLKAAYLHVIADALTSVAAIVALLFGRFFGWVFLDPAIGIAGSLLIARWAIGLLKETSAILLDGSVGAETREAIRSAIESSPGCRVCDLHVWAVAPGHLAVILSVEAAPLRQPAELKALLAGIPSLSHVNIEIRQS